MLERGLLAEVRGLLAAAAAARRGRSPRSATGRRCAWCAASSTPDEAERAIVTETMRFAKRQMTWFRHQARTSRWFEDPDEAHAAARRAGSTRHGPATAAALTGARKIGRICRFAVALHAAHRHPPDSAGGPGPRRGARRAAPSTWRARRSSRLRPGGRLALPRRPRGRDHGPRPGAARGARSRPSAGAASSGTPLTVGQELDLFYLPRAAGPPQEQEEEVELSDRDVVVGYYDGRPAGPRAR